MMALLVEAHQFQVLLGVLALQVHESFLIHQDAAFLSRYFYELLKKF
jgi:hypothetical protein